MVSSLTVVQNLTCYFHGSVIVAEFSLGYGDFLPFWVPCVGGDLALVDEVGLVLAPFLNSEEGVVATEEVKIGHVGETSCPDIELQYF